MNSIYPNHGRSYYEDAAGTPYWESVWQNLPPLQQYQGPVFEHHPVLSRFLPKTGGDAIEIGCVPGNYMVYLNKEFGYRVEGLDYSKNLTYVRANLEFNGIYSSQLYNVDFFEFEPEKKYDLVFSSGFVEHFEDHRRVVSRHVEFAKTGGMVVIIVPNLTHIHWILCRLFDRETLQVHRLQLMRQEILRRTLEESGVQVLHCKYHRTFRPTYKLPSAVDLASRAVQKFLRLSRLDDIGNAFGSPYLISVSVKR